MIIIRDNIQIILFSKLGGRISLPSYWNKHNTPNEINIKRYNLLSSEANLYSSGYIEIDNKSIVYEII